MILSIGTRPRDLHDVNPFDCPVARDLVAASVRIMSGRYGHPPGRIVGVEAAYKSIEDGSAEGLSRKDFAGQISPMWTSGGGGPGRTWPRVRVPAPTTETGSRCGPRR
jgi:hypothetical protein